MAQSLIAPASAASINRCHNWLKVVKEQCFEVATTYAIANERLRTSPFSAPNPQSRPAATSMGEQIQLWHFAPSYLFSCDERWGWGVFLARLGLVDWALLLQGRLLKLSFVQGNLSLPFQCLFIAHIIIPCIIFGLLVDYVTIKPQFCWAFKPSSSKLSSGHPLHREPIWPQYCPPTRWPWSPEAIRPF